MSTNQNAWTRRSVLTAAGTAAATALLNRTPTARAAEDAAPSATKGNINHSVCLWCYKNMKSQDMAPHAKRLGLKAIDLLTPDQFAPLKDYGLICSMTSGVAGGITSGFNRKENHDKINDTLRKLCDANAANGYPNVICFSGNRNGMDDAEGMKNCAEGIKKVIGYFEEKKVNLQMELLNSKVNHKDYMCDRSPWGIELVKMVGSERFILLYDIYHMQIDEGDVIATIQKNHQYFGHYHTGGVPGRNEIDDTQELNYPAIMRAIVKTGFKGYVAQEFIPKNKDMIASLSQAVKICDV
ncbi:MAG TPA: sugar phosphate isomerase/epimerase family protein [Tepidisphaeraceae bacterium]|jgi:hydroxypyruvate isomerase|nr:sugar phosphate isomerase/epimerase family protein [Tepidisphaeraceae bacterium]